MEQPHVVPPGADELQAYSLGKCDRQHAAEIEAYLADGPDCNLILERAPDDELVRHLRGVGKLPAADGARPPLPTPGPAGEADTNGDDAAEAAALRDHPATA